MSIRKLINEFKKIEPNNELAIKAEKELDYLNEKDRFLSALEAAGVDNWGGYEIAYDILKEWNGEE